MSILPTPPERFAQVQEELRGTLGVGPGGGPSSELANVLETADLTSPGLFMFRGRRFQARPLSFTAGLELQQIGHRLNALTVSDNEEETLKSMGETLRLMQDAVSLFHRNCVPRNIIYRLFWRLLSNPFANATGAEVAELLGFFFAARMMSSVQVLGSTQQAQRRRPRSLTQQTGSQGSLERILSGQA